MLNISLRSGTKYISSNTIPFGRISEVKKNTEAYITEQCNWTSVDESRKIIMKGFLCGNAGQKKSILFRSCLLIMIEEQNETRSHHAARFPRFHFFPPPLSVTWSRTSIVC